MHLQSQLHPTKMPSSPRSPQSSRVWPSLALSALSPALGGAATSATTVPYMLLMPMPEPQFLWEPPGTVATTRLWTLTAPYTPGLEFFPVVWGPQAPCDAVDFPQRAFCSLQRLFIGRGVVLISPFFISHKCRAAASCSPSVPVIIRSQTHHVHL